MGTAIGSTLRNIAWIFVGISCIYVIANAEVGLNEEGDPIAFYSPLEEYYPSFDEASFSVPKPLVVIHPVVFGNPDEYPNHTTIQQVGPAEVRIRIRGTVFDFLADMVADNLADIKQVRIYSHTSGSIATVPLEAANSRIEHPFGEFFDKSPTAIAIRPFPFAGQFDFGEFSLPINSGYNAISVEATNLNESSGIATLSIKATIDRQAGRYDLIAEVSEDPDEGLYNPIVVYINDPDVTIKNYTSRRARINGHEIGLRFVDGQLQLDRPIIGLNHSPSVPIPNVVNVVGDPSGFLIEYGDWVAEFGWSYTANAPSAEQTLLSASQ